MALAHADALRQAGGFSETLACCLKGRPRLSDCLAGLNGQPAYLVPLLMAEGHAYKALCGTIAERSNVTLCATLGTHPRLAVLIAKMAADACRAQGWNPAETEIILAAHGTRRDPDSGVTARSQAARIAATDAFAAIRVGFLEEEPLLADLLAPARERQRVAVGFFAEPGVHGDSDLVRLTTAAGVVYAGPVGTEARIPALIVDLVAETQGKNPI